MATRNAKRHGTCDARSWQEGMNNVHHRFRFFTQVMTHVSFEFLQVHRPRTDGTDGGGGGKRHNKRVRTPHNTRETQRQKAIGHGETLMPNNVIYRTPNSVIAEEEAAYMSGQYQMRPNSIELRHSYQSEGVDGYAPTSQMHQQSQYATAHHNQQQQHHLPPQQMQHHQQQQQQQSMYDEGMYNSQNLYASGQSPYSTDTLYSPSRNKVRPTQPPPAPPSTGNTPTGSNANTPTRSRSISANRDALPPPPPVPLESMSPPHQMQITNGNASVAAKILGRSHSTSRSGSPQMNMNTGAPMDQNALVMAQLNSQINSLNNLNLQMTQQMNALNNDLPPPPPIPEEVSAVPIRIVQQPIDQRTHSKKTVSFLQHLTHHQSPPKSVAPPPPPPPPPLNDQSPSNTYKPLMNGNLNNGSAGGKLITPAKLPQAKKILPSSAHDDTRNDLLKAIRDGKSFEYMVRLWFDF